MRTGIAGRRHLCCHLFLRRQASGILRNHRNAGIDQTAGAAASLAVNYLNFKDTDPEYAQKCLDYALALYDFSVKTHHEVGDDTQTVDSLGYDGGFYTSSYDYDELAWAAVWLYYCTENYDYIDDIISVDESVTGEMVRTRTPAI